MNKEDFIIIIPTTTTAEETMKDLMIEDTMRDLTKEDMMKDIKKKSIKKEDFHLIKDFQEDLHQEQDIMIIFIEKIIIKMKDINS
jgi:hypothetical protein